MPPSARLGSSFGRPIGAAIPGSASLIRATSCDPLGREAGEALWPERFPLKALERIRANTFGRDWSALYQQRPVPEEGEFFLVDNMPTKDVSDVVERVRAWDLAGSRDGDFTVGVRLGKTRDDRYVVEHVARFRGLPNVVEDRVLETARADGSRVKISLPKDPGQAGVHQVLSLTRLLAGFDVVSSPETGDKVTRAKPFAAQVNVGNVALADGGWVDAYREELRAFPHGKYDDQVDASSRGFMELTQDDDLAIFLRAHGPNRNPLFSLFPRFSMTGV
jgi:predicted phage terminase large subunit-like protein